MAVAVEVATGLIRPPSLGTSICQGTALEKKDKKKKKRKEKKKKKRKKERKENENLRVVTVPRDESGAYPQEVCSVAGR